MIKNYENNNSDHSEITKFANNSIEAVLCSHIHQAATQAVVGEDKEYFPQNGANVFQFFVIKVFKNKCGDSCDDPNE